MKMTINTLIDTVRDFDINVVELRENGEDTRLFWEDNEWTDKYDEIHLTDEEVREMEVVGILSRDDSLVVVITR